MSKGGPPFRWLQKPWGDPFQIHGLRERVKGVLEGFKDYVMGGLVPPLTITPKDHRPSVESRMFIVKEGKLSRYSSFISIAR
jgi:hypothetical protein